MKVTKAQAQANRAHIVETAAALFRERGFDGVGIAELMAVAGFTHGGFYKHFASKADLLAETAACGLTQGAARTDGMDAVAFVDQYLSRGHRDGRSDGCTLAALCGDAARQPPAVKMAFEQGLERQLANLARPAGAGEGVPVNGDARARHLQMLAQLTGAVMLSRACRDDSPLADEILAACRAAALASLRDT